MSGYLNRLVERTLGLATPVQPALASRYAPAPDANGAPEPLELREQFETPPTPERRPPAQRPPARECPAPDRPPAPQAGAEGQAAVSRDAIAPEAPAAGPTSPASPSPAPAGDRAVAGAVATAALTLPGDPDAPLVPLVPVNPATALSLASTLPPASGAPAPADAAPRRAARRADNSAGEGRVAGPGQGAETRPSPRPSAAEPPQPAATTPEDTLLPTPPPSWSEPVRERREPLPAARADRARGAPVLDRAAAGDLASATIPDDDPVPVEGTPLTRSATRERGAAPLLAESAARREAERAATGQVGRRAAPAPPPAPTVRVSIGRIEVRAIQPAPPPVAPPAPRRSGPRLSLEDYLRGRGAREGGA